MKRRPPPCGLVGRHGLKRARLYVSGWCCDLHTPAALAGRPESPPGPGWPIHRIPGPDAEPPTEQEQHT